MNTGSAIPSQPATAVPGISVLVVEDNVDAAESMMMLLEVLGHRARIAHDGETALAAARQDAPDAMLIDIGLPDLDGYELARLLRDQPAFDATVLIALTGYGRDEDRRLALQAGFDHHLVKPVEFDVLRALLAPIARLRAGSRASGSA